MSIIREKELTLPVLIAKSNLIVKATYVESYSQQMEFSKEEDQQEDIPPFTVRGSIFKIDGILKNSDNIQTPETIRIPNENHRRHLSQHKEQYANGKSKSFTVLVYNGGNEEATKAEILFLHHFNNKFEWAARNAFESNDALKEIIQILEDQQNGLVG